MSSVEISYSRVQTYERCPWMYHLVYNEGWRAGPKAPAAFGQSLHRTLAVYLSDDNTERSLDRLFEIFDQHWVNEGFGSPQQTIEAYERGKMILENFFKIDAKRTSKVFATEKNFDIDFGNDIHFKGTVDRIDQHADGRYEIIEYKTGTETWSKERVASDRQMSFYALGLAKTLGVSSLKLTYYFLSSGSAIETQRSQTQLEEIQNLITTAAEKIRSGDFTPNHASCKRCEFGRRCKNFKPS